MSNRLEQYRRLVELIERQLEQCITSDEFSQLENLIGSDTDARRFYREYLDLHGMLHWGTALTDQSDVASASLDDAALPPSEDGDFSRSVAADSTPARKVARRRSMTTIAALCAAVVVVAAIFLTGRPDEQNQLAGDPVNPSAPQQPEEPATELNGLVADTDETYDRRTANGPVALPLRNGRDSRGGSATAEAGSPITEDTLVARAADKLY